MITYEENKDMEEQEQGQKNEETAKKIHDEYLASVNFLSRFSAYEKAEKNYDFYIGDQWKNLVTDGEFTPPIVNIIKPIVINKVAMSAMQGVTISYRSLNYGKDYKIYEDLCEKLNIFITKYWENMKMDFRMWDMTENACIYGDTFGYFYYDKEKDTVAFEEHDSVNVNLGDEQEADLQKQPYIIIAQRMTVRNVKETARRNGIPERLIELIKSDKETQHMVGKKSKEEVETEGKCLVLLRMYKDEKGTVHFTRSTDKVVFEPDTEIKNLKVYPLVQFVWRNEKGSARGTGEVYHLIPNQIEINKGWARLFLYLKSAAFPKMVYDNNAFTQQDIENMASVGAVLGVDSTKLQDVANAIRYISAPGVDPGYANLVTGLAEKTKELSGNSDVMTGQINPERASGAAIIAVQNAAAQNTTRQKERYKECVENIAEILFSLFVAYNPDGIDIVVNRKNDKHANTDLNELQKMIQQMDPDLAMNQMVQGQIQNPPMPIIEEYEEDEPEVFHADPIFLQRLKVEIKVDVVPTNPFSKYASEQFLQSLLSTKTITFEQFVKALPPDGTAPKQTLMRMLEEEDREYKEKLITEAVFEVCKQQAELINRARGVISNLAQRNVEMTGISNAMSEKLGEDNYEKAEMEESNNGEIDITPEKKMK